MLLPRPELCSLDDWSCQQLCEGKVEGGPTRTYKGMAVNKVWRDFMVLVGDFKGDDTGGYSSFADKYFEDENFVGRYASAHSVVCEAGCCGCSRRRLLVQALHQGHAEHGKRWSRHELIHVLHQCEAAAPLGYVRTCEAVAGAPPYVVMLLQMGATWCSGRSLRAWTSWTKSRAHTHSTASPLTLL